MTRLGRLLVGLAVLALFSVPSAHAATYLFSFTASQLLTALSGDANQNKSATFAVFLAPTNVGTYGTGYTYGTETSPVPTGADDWQATVDSSNPFSSTAPDLEFGKYATQTSVTVLANSTAYSTGWNGGTMSGKTYSDGGTPPLYWGSTVGTIAANMSTSADFAFTLVSSSITPGESVTFSGEASQIYYDCPQTVVDVPFTLTLTAETATPEPDTMVLLGLGVASLLAGVIRKKAKKRTAE
jgi:hypothetical protein